MLSDRSRWIARIALFATVGTGALGAPAASGPGAGSDPLTGLWEGRASGPPPIVPAEGIPFGLRVRRVDGRTARVRLDIDGDVGVEVDATYDPESARLAFRPTFMGVPLSAELAIEGDELAGSIGGLGLSVQVTAKRTLSELPPEGEALQFVAFAELTAADWLADLDALASRLPARHVNLFHTLSRGEWDAAVGEVRSALPSLDGLGSALALARLVARVGDAHTELAWRALPGLEAAPVRFRFLADGLFITAIDERWGEALAARVTRIGDVSAEEALVRVAATFGAENDGWRREKAPPLLCVPSLLAALGVVEAPDRIPLVVEVELGVERALTVEMAGTGRWLSAPDPALDPVPLWQQRTDESYRFEVLGEGALYFAYNRCAEDPARPMAPFVESLFAAFDAGARGGSEITRLVVDLRHNTGGNSAVLAPFLGRAAPHPRLAEPASLIVLIGPATYSSGMLNAIELRRIGAVLVGEPTGGKPNSYGELRSFPLPRSGLRVFHSTKYFRLLEDDPPAVEPDVRVEFTSSDLFAGRDPVLERALALVPEAAPLKPPTTTPPGQRRDGR